jgi:hypothetical protein
MNDVEIEGGNQRKMGTKETTCTSIIGQGPNRQNEEEKKNDAERESSQRICRRVVTLWEYDRIYCVLSLQLAGIERKKHISDRVLGLEATSSRLQ